MSFLLLILIPSLGVLSPEQREALARAVASRFRWVTWSAVALLLLSGLYNVRRFYWEEAWGPAWKFLSLKIALSFALFMIVLALTIPFRLFEPMRARRRAWLLAAFIIGVVVVLISAYLRRG
jgi:putative copper export protein